MIYRNLDGVYFRVYRDDKWQSICFTDLTEDEAEAVTKDRSEEWLTSLYEELVKVLLEIKHCINNQSVDNAICLVLESISVLTIREKLFTIKNVIKNLADYYDIINEE